MAAGYTINIVVDDGDATNRLRRLSEQASDAAKPVKIHIDLPNINEAHKDLERLGQGFQTLREYGKYIPVIDTYVNLLNRSLKLTNAEVNSLVPLFEAFVRYSNPIRGMSDSVNVFTSSINGAVQSTAKLGFAVFGVTQSINVLKDAYSGFFDQTIGREVALRESMLKTATTLAGTNRIFQNGVEITDPTAQLAALEGPIDASIERIRKKSLDISGVTSEAVISTFQVVAQNIGQFGGTLKDAEDLAAQFAGALGTLGLSDPIYTRQEIGSLLQGTVDQNSILAKTLGISNEEINRAKTSAGGLVQFLNERLAAFGAGQKAASLGFRGITSNLKELREEMSRAFGAPFLDPMLKRLQAIYEPLSKNSDRLQQMARAGGSMVSSTLSTVTSIAGNSRAGQAFTTENVGKGAAFVEQSFGKATTYIQTQLTQIAPALTSLFTKVQEIVAMLGKSIIELGVTIAKVKIDSIEIWIRTFNAVIPAVQGVVAIYSQYLQVAQKIMESDIGKYLIALRVQWQALDNVGVLPLARFVLGGVALIGAIKQIIETTKSVAAAIITPIQAVLNFIGSAVTTVGAKIASIGQTIVSTFANISRVVLVNLSLIISQIGRIASELAIFIAKTQPGLIGLIAPLKQLGVTFNNVAGDVKVAENSVNQFAQRGKLAMDGLSASAAKAGAGIKATGEAAKSAALGGIETAGKGIANVALMIGRNIASMFLWQLAITLISDLLRRLFEWMDSQKTQENFALANKMMANGLKDVAEQAAKTGKELDAATQAQLDFVKSAQTAKLDGLKKELKELTETAIKTRESYERLRGAKVAPTMKMVKESEAARDKKGTEVNKLQAEIDEPKNKAKRGEELELKRKENQAQIEQLAQFELDTRKSIEDKIFQTRMQLRQKELDIFKAEGELRIAQVQQANEALLDGVSTNSHAALKALFVYIASKSKQELEIEARKRAAQISRDQLDRQMMETRWNLEKQIAELKKKIGDYEIKIADQRIKIEERIAAIRNGSITYVNPGEGKGGKTGLYMGSTGFSTGRHYHVEGASSEAEATGIFARPSDYNIGDRPGFSKWRGRNHNGYDLTAKGGGRDELQLAPGYRLTGYDRDQGGAGNVARIERTTDQKKYKVFHLESAPQDWSLAKQDAASYAGGSGGALPSGVSTNMNKMLNFIAKLESDFNPNAVSSVGAKGMFQFTKDTLDDAKRWGYNKDALLGKAPGGVATQKTELATFIRKEHPIAYEAIEKGDFGKAEEKLKGRWLSLKGGGEQATGTRREEALAYLRGKTAPDGTGGAGGGRPPVTLNIDTSKLDSAFNALTTAQQKYDEISAALDRLKTKADFKNFTNTLFDPHALESLEAEYAKSKDGLEKLSAMGDSAYNPQQLQIYIEHQAEVSKREKAFADARSVTKKAENLSEEERKRTIETINDKEKQNIAQEEKRLQIKLIMLDITKEQAKIESLRNDTKDVIQQSGKDVISARYDLEGQFATNNQDKRRAQAQKQIELKRYELTEGGTKALGEKAELEMRKFSEAALAAADALAKIDDTAKNMRIAELIHNWRMEMSDTQGQVISLSGNIQSELSSAMSTAVSNVISGTGKVQDAFSTMFKNIGDSFIKMATEMITKMLVIQALQLVTGLIGGGLGGGGGGGFKLGGEGSGGSGLGSGSLYGQSLPGGSMGLPSFSDSFGSWAGGGVFGTRAAGGPVESNVPYLIGERGMEMFIPSTAGTVLPADRTAALLSGNRGALSGLASADMGGTPEESSPEGGVGSNNSSSSSYAAISTINNLFNSNRSSLTNINSTGGDASSAFATNRDVINTVQSTIKETARDAALGGSTSVNVDYNISRINSVDYVTAEEFRSGINQATAAGAKQGQQKALSALRNQPGVRRSVGMR